MEDTTSRRLDTAAKSSMDVVQLNDMVIKLRPSTKAARTRVINKLNKLVRTHKERHRKLRREGDLARAQRHLDEMQELKQVPLDQLTKFVMANTCSLESREAQRSAKMKGMVRVACMKGGLSAAVEGWRREHTDWREMAAFLLSKNTGRRMKKNKKPKKGDAEQRLAERPPNMAIDLTNRIAQSAAAGSEEDVMESETVSQAQMEDADPHERDNGSAGRKQKRSKRNASSMVNGTSKPHDPGVSPSSDEQGHVKVREAGGHFKVTPVSGHNKVSVPKGHLNTSPSKRHIKVSPPEGQPKVTPAPRSSDMVIRRIDWAAVDQGRDEIPLDDDESPDDLGFMFTNESKAGAPAPRRHRGAFFQEEDGGDVSAGSDDVTQPAANRDGRSVFIPALGAERSKGKSNKVRSKFKPGTPRDRKGRVHSGAGGGQRRGQMTLTSGAVTLTPDSVTLPPDTESLHPSWLASLRRKMQRAILPAAGTKTTFDDDD